MRRHRHVRGRWLRRRASALERDPRPTAGGHRPPREREEVAAAVHFAREHDLEIAVRSGGHSAAGLAGRRRRPRRRPVGDCAASRSTRAPGSPAPNGGALLGELDIAAQAHGLVCPVGVVGHTGVAGLTLGGGIGRLQRHFGLTIDNLAAVELVTADGRLVRRDRARRAGAVLGPARRRLELRDRDGVRVPAPAVRTATSTEAC